MDEPSVTSLSLAARLAQPLQSVSQLLDLLVPPLVACRAVDDLSSLVHGPARTAEVVDVRRFVRRQLGLVQEVLIERVWPEWESAVTSEVGSSGVLVLERYFVPPTSSLASTSSSRTSPGAEIAISAYGVLSSLLWTKSASSLPPRAIELALGLLARLVQLFSVEQLYIATVGQSEHALTRPQGPVDCTDDEDVAADPAAISRFDSCLRHLSSVPSRAANAWGSIRDKHKRDINIDLPPALEPEQFASALSTSALSLFWRLAGDTNLFPHPPSLVQPLVIVLVSPNFVPSALPHIVPRILQPPAFPASGDDLLQRARYRELWRAVIAEMSERDLARFLRDVLQVFEHRLAGDSPSSVSTALGAAFALKTLFGPLSPSNTTTWRTAWSVVFSTSAQWKLSVLPRALVLWTGETETSKVALLEEVLHVWAAKEEIRNGTEGRRLFVTAVLLCSAVSLPTQHPSIVGLSRSPAFLDAVSTHFSLVAPLPRMLGMLVAEVVSGRTVEPNGELKPLSFGDDIWAGDKREHVIIRELRAMVDSFHGALATGPSTNWQEDLRNAFREREESAQTSARPVPTKFNTVPIRASSVEEPETPALKRPLISIIGSDESDSDDDLEPFALPPGPSTSTLEALASTDPALYHSAIPSQASATSGPAGSASQTRRRGKLRPPVYIAELVSYLKGQDPQGAKEEADGEAERIEVGLREGEALVRRKTGWGGELRENAVDLAFTLMALQNQFELDDFEDLKQRVLVALIVACPTEVAPAVIEQYFTTSYSIAQRHILLASLAFAARELAGLPIPSAVTPSVDKFSDVERFPSKQLPSAMHRRIVGSATGSRQLEALSTDLTHMALSGAREDAEHTLPEAAKEKLLSVRQRTSTRSAVLSKQQPAPSTPSFTLIAADTFILPLVNRFWLYLRDMATSALSTRANGGSYLGGTAAPVLLEPILLSKFLATIAVLVHAARHSPAFLAIIVPEVLAFVLAIKPSPSSRASAGTGPRSGDADDESGLDADLITSAALELVLVALDATVQLDGGRTLMSSSAAAHGGGGALVVETKEWAEAVFEREERRGGSDGTGRAGRAAAGVLLRIEEVSAKWRLSVGW